MRWGDDSAWGLEQISREVHELNKALRRGSYQKQGWGKSMIGRGNSHVECPEERESGGRSQGGNHEVKELRWGPKTPGQWGEPWENFKLGDRPFWKSPRASSIPSRVYKRLHADNTGQPQPKPLGHTRLKESRFVWI